MKSTLLVILAVVVFPSHIQGSCLSNFEVSIKGPCNYDKLRDAVQDRLYNPDELSYDSISCDHGADEEISLIFPNMTIFEIKQYVAHSCEQAGSETHTGLMPWASVTDKGDKFDKEHFDGNGEWNEERQTNKPHQPYVLNEPSNVLKRDAQRVDDVYEGFAQSGPIQWPGDAPTSMSNFENCQLQSAMCCFVQDRQANDNNGNCHTPYDSNCIDKDPADNTEICGVSMKRSIKDSVHVDDGFVIYEKDEEGPTHCHGFAWGEDEREPDFRYRANNLFYVSMSDHMHDRGYVRAVQGAPMCACVENMPIVTRSDCTEIHATEFYKFTFTFQPEPTFNVAVTYTEIDFNACSAQTNNDLQSFMERLLNEGRVTQEKYEKFRQTIRGNTNCPSGQNDLLFEQGYTYAPLNVEDFHEIGELCNDRNGNDQNLGEIRLMEGDFTVSEENKTACLEMCSSISDSVRATGCQTGTQGCYIHTQAIYSASSSSGKTCWIAKRYTSPMEYKSNLGWCHDPNVHSQNNGVIKIGNQDYGPSEEKKQECFDMCTKIDVGQKITGCLAIWQQGNRGCYIHTKPVVMGNWHHRHNCWVAKSPDFYTVDDFQPKQGHCLRFDGNTEHAFHIGNGDYNSEYGKIACLELCLSYSHEHIKGCQAETHRCYLYTKEVSFGSGHGGKTCFVPGH